ncbi:hypothetical protein [Inquilinus sp.]|uniref:hypothetical protein n=1 Tax=Inquilinus sp. TaxID=1932117 RepID=UPI003782EB36
MLAILCGGVALAAFYGLALCRAAWRDEEEGMQPTQVSHRWVIQPRRWSVMAPTRQTVEIRASRPRRHGAPYKF